MHLNTNPLEFCVSPVPRYHCYPIPSLWTLPPTSSEWFEAVDLSLSDECSSWSLYLHLPFCESLCTYCACNVSITRDHDREEPYRDLLLKEWNLYKRRSPLLLKRPLKSIHIGGGSPTFFSAENLRFLISGILEDVQCSDQFFGSIEVDPRRASQKHLLELHRLGFRQLNLGVQDFDPEVQRLVNRNQPPALVGNLVSQAREIGYPSIHFDLIYGLPKQDVGKILNTIESTLELRPQGVALYGLAKVPWIKPTQRLFRDEDLPSGQVRTLLRNNARHLLVSKGNYFNLGMDCFVLCDDPLFEAFRNKSLHRNFTGYTRTRSDLLLGLGVSSISETPTCFHQNEKVLPIYERKVVKGETPTLRGHLLTEEDQLSRAMMRQVLTQSELIVSREDKTRVESLLRPMIETHLVELEDDHLRIADRGRSYLPEICSLWDRSKYEEPSMARGQPF